MSFSIGSRVYYRGQAEYPHGTVFEVETGLTDRLLYVRWDGEDRPLGPYIADDLRAEFANVLPGQAPFTVAI